MINNERKKVPKVNFKNLSALENKWNKIANLRYLTTE